MIFQLIVLLLLRMVENRIDNTIVQYYDIGRAFLVANERNLKYLRHVVQDKMLYEKLRKDLEQDRRTVSKSMGTGCF